MSMLSPEGRAIAQADYDRQRDELDAQIEACQYCRAAKTRKAKKEAERGRELPGMKTECSKHKDRMRAIWVCSPLSETYWAS